MNAAEVREVAGALYAAAAHNGVNEIRQLLERGVPPDALDMDLSLRVASARGFLNSVKLLLDYGIDPNRAAQYDGSTVLHEAVQGAIPINGITWSDAEKHRATIRALVEAGADPSIKNSHGRSAFDLAAKMPDVLAILRNVNKTPDLTSVFVKEKLINAYKELGIHSSASQKDIRAAYLKLRKQKEQGKGSKRLGSLTAAYNLLKSPSQRKKYDEVVEQPRKKILAKLVELCANESDPVTMNSFEDLSLEELRRVYVIYPNTDLLVENARKATCYEEATLVGLRESGRTMSNPLTREPLKTDTIRQLPSSRRT